MRKYLLVVTLVLFIFLNVSVIGGEEEQPFTLKLYQGPYNSGELRAEIMLTHPIDNRYSIGTGWIDPGFLTEGPGGDIWVDVHENTRVTSIWVDKPRGTLYLELVGQSGAQGHLLLSVSKRTVPSRDDLKIYLDNQPIEITIGENGIWYTIEMSYTHSTRVLRVGGLQADSPQWYAQPLNLAMIVIAVVAALGALYWFKFRRRAT